MPRGDKSAYTGKQQRQADHIAESYEERGLPEAEAERRAWATVNKQDGGGKTSGSGRGKPRSNVSAKRGGAVSAARPAADRSASAKKAAATRKRNARKAG